MVTTNKSDLTLINVKDVIIALILPADSLYSPIVFYIWRFPIISEYESYSHSGSICHAVLFGNPVAHDLRSIARLF